MPRRPAMIETSYKPLEQFIEEANKFREEVRPLLKRAIIYEGRYDDGKKSGKGDFLYPNGDFYRGNFDRDLREGFGMIVSFVDNYVYKGEFKGDQIRGAGICVLSNGMIIDGYFNGVSFREVNKFSLKTSPMTLRLNACTLMESFMKVDGNSTNAMAKANIFTSIFQFTTGTGLKT